MLLAIGSAVAFNILIIHAKISKGRYADASLDFICLTVLSVLFGGSSNGLVVSTIASAIISLVLLIFPPRLTELFQRRFSLKHVVYYLYCRWR